jgi:hypothetical protein
MTLLNSNISSAARTAAYKNYQSHLKTLSKAQMDRAMFLRADIEHRENNPLPEPTGAQFWVRMAGMFLFLICDVVLIGILLSVIWRGIAGRSASAATRRRVAARVAGGFIAMSVVSMEMMVLKDQILLPHSYYDLSARAIDLRHRARQAEPTCGAFNSRGMW